MILIFLLSALLLFLFPLLIANMLLHIAVIIVAVITGCYYSYSMPIVVVIGVIGIWNEDREDEGSACKV